MWVRVSPTWAHGFVLTREGLAMVITLIIFIITEVTGISLSRSSLKRPLSDDKLLQVPHFRFRNASIGTGSCRGYNKHHEGTYYNLEI